MCCGRNRMLQRTAAPSPVHNNVHFGGQQRQPGVPFINVGNAGMTVRGPISGIEYRFDQPGTRIEVDPRDLILLASIRQLRQVK
jgi:hypothetical protein